MVDTLDNFKKKYDVISNVDNEEMKEIAEFISNPLEDVSKFELLNIPYIANTKITETTLIEYVATYMFKNYKETIEKEKKCCSDSINYDKQKNILDKFQLVMKSIKCMSKGSSEFLNKSEDELEALSELATIIDIKENLRCLVEAYLKLTGKKNSEKRYLIVVIKNIEKDKLIKDEKKYLIPDNLIVLFYKKTETKRNQTTKQAKQNADKSNETGV